MRTSQRTNRRRQTFLRVNQKRGLEGTCHERHANFLEARETKSDRLLKKHDCDPSSPQSSRSARSARKFTLFRQGGGLFRRRVCRFIRSSPNMRIWGYRIICEGAQSLPPLPSCARALAIVTTDDHPFAIHDHDRGFPKNLTHVSRFISVLRRRSLPKDGSCSHAESLRCRLSYPSAHLFQKLPRKKRVHERTRCAWAARKEGAVSAQQ